MSLSINTNIASLNAQRNLTSSQDALATSLKRLSSGLRINSARDDAAGLAIAQRFTSQIRGLDQAVRNANDGISLSQVAEGALGESGNLLQRIRELAVQSANSTNSASDRQALNSETSQLLAELGRIAGSTQFNGQNILDGSFTAAQFQVGANANQTISISVGNASIDALGSFQGLGAAAVSGASLVAGDLVINGADIGATTSGSAEAKTEAINKATAQTGVTATASTTLTSANTLIANQSLQSGDLVINGVNIGGVAGSLNVASQGTNLATAINAVSNQTGVTATADSNTGQLTLASTTGADIAITGSNGDAGSNRLENATGLEVRDTAAAASTNTVTFANGGAGVSTITIADDEIANSNTFQLNGTTYEYNADAGGGLTAGGNVALGVAATGVGSGATNATALQNALTANSTNATIGSTGAGVVTVTSNVFTATTTQTNVSTTAALATAISNDVGAAGAAIGDTVAVGGVTYEFVFAGGTPLGSGNTAVALGTSDPDAGTQFANAINAQQTAGNTNIVASGTATVTLTSSLLGSGISNLAVTEPVSTGTNNAVVGGTATAGADGVTTTLTGRGTISLSSSEIFSITENNIGGLAKSGLASATPTLTAINTVDLTSVEGANAAISLVDGALAQVSSIRGDLGAVQNRLSSTIANLSTASENLNAARSRVQDADFAAETAALTRNQVLQQAGVAILAQANSLPQLALSLLQ